MLQTSRQAFPSVVLVFVWLFCAPLSLRAQDTLCTVALTGTPVSATAPDTVISTLGTRTAPVLNNYGLTAFEATIREADVVKQAILTEGGGAGLRVASDGLGNLGQLHRRLQRHLRF